MTFTSAAVSAAFAHDVALAADDVADVDSLDARGDLHHFPDEFMPDHERRLDVGSCPRVPVDDVQICAANACAQHLDDRFARSERGIVDLIQLNARSGVSFDQRFHAPSVPNAARLRTLPVGLPREQNAVDDT